MESLVEAVCLTEETFMRNNLGSETIFTNGGAIGGPGPKRCLISRPMLKYKMTRYG